MKRSEINTAIKRMERLIYNQGIFTQMFYHDFELEQGSKEVLLGEVSMCNDDNTDNRFYRPVRRFSKITEDEPIYRLLCTEYPQKMGGVKIQED